MVMKLEKLLFFLCAFGLLYSAFLMLLPKPPVYYTVLYLDPGYYGENRSVLFARFGIENHEATDLEYSADFFLDKLNDDNSFDSFLLGQKEYFIARDENFFGFQSFQLPKQFEKQKNLRFRIQTSAFDINYSVHFWLEQKKH